MISMLLWTPSILILASIMLVSGTAIWILLAGTQLRLIPLSALCILQSVNIALAGTALPAQFQMPMLAIAFPSLSLLWVLMTLATMNSPDHSTNTAEPDK